MSAALAAASAVAIAGCGSTSEGVPVFDQDVYVTPQDASADAAGDATGDAAPAPGDAPATAARMISWDANLMDVGGEVGSIHTLRCGPGDLRLVFGTTIYAGHSSVCMAAYHSELITMSAGGTFRLRVEPVQMSFVGSLRNGVMSGRWLDPAPGFSFPDARPPESM